MDDGSVQDQEQRDAKSVTIVTGLLLCAGVLVVGSLLLWIADELVGVSRSVGHTMTVALEAAAVVVLVIYVARNRRR